MISRSTLIGALVVVELAIVGMCAKAVAGGAAVPSPFAAFRGPDAAEHFTPLDRTFVTLPDPHVVIGVHDVHVIVEAADVSTVRAVETVQRAGYVTGTIVPVTAQQTPDGVRISSSGDSDVVAFGSFERSVRVTVPAHARVEVTSADRVDVSGLRSKLVVHVVEGPIYVNDHRGDLDLSCSDGRIVLTDVQGADLAVNTRDGRLLFTRVAADRLDASSNDGRIAAVDLRAVDGALTTRDGNVNVSFTPDSDATVNVRAGGDDHVRVSGLPTSDDANDRSVVHLGSGRGHFEVSSGDGSITITQGAKV